METMEGESPYIEAEMQEALSSDTADSDEDSGDTSSEANVANLFTEADGKFRCDLCYKLFDRRRYVSRHIRKTHRSPNKGQHQCPICDRLMMQKSDLKRHLATHTDVKEHVCPICDKTFARKDSMLVHKRQHSNDYMFKCVECGRGFHSRVSLESHMRIHTGDRPFSCPSCAATFRQKGDLTRHMQSHMGIKPFSCSTCGKTFGRNADLRRHQMTHEEEKPWHCDACDKGFSRKYLYTKHMLWHEANPGVEYNNNTSNPPSPAKSAQTVLTNIVDNKLPPEGGLHTRSLTLPQGEVPGYLSNLDSLPANHGNSLQLLAERLKSKMENLKQLPGRMFSGRSSHDTCRNASSSARPESARGKSASRKRKSSVPTKRSVPDSSSESEEDTTSYSRHTVKSSRGYATPFTSYTTSHSGFSYIEVKPEAFSGQTSAQMSEPLDLSVAPTKREDRDSNDNINIKL